MEPLDPRDVDVDDIINVQQVAELFGCTIETINKHAVLGNLPHIKIFGDDTDIRMFRFSRRQLLAHIERNTRGPKSAAEPRP